MSELTRRTYAAFAAVAIAASAHAGGNLVNNPGFETGNLDGWGTSPALMGSDFGVVMPGHTGSFSMKFSADTTNYDAIFQDVMLVPGQQYEFSYWIMNSGAGADSLVVFLGGAFSNLETPVGAQLEQWEQRSIQFNAGVANAELRISGYDNNASFFIDDISLTLVPTPGTTALLSFAAIFVLGGRIMRNN